MLNRKKIAHGLFIEMLYTSAFLGVLFVVQLVIMR